MHSKVRTREKKSSSNDRSNIIASQDPESRTPKRLVNDIDDIDNVRVVGTDMKIRTDNTYSHRANELTSQDEVTEICVYNDANVLIKKKDVLNILKGVGLTTSKEIDIKTFRLAMTHESYAKSFYVFDADGSTITGICPKKNKKNNIGQVSSLKKIVINNDKPLGCVELQEESNQRLEFLGDSVWHFILAEYLFNRYESQDEGFLTTLRVKLENGEMAALLAKSIGLGKFLLLSKNTEEIKGRYNKKMGEDVFEAFIAALYKSCGMSMCRKFIVNIIEQRVNITQLLAQDTNYKNQLLIYFHQQRWGDPVYQEIKRDINQVTGERFFKVKVIRKPDFILGIATANTKTKAEQLAAKNTLLKLKVIKDDDESDDD